MNKTEKTKIIYVLGAAYSGSTLMGLALDKHEQIINLGEVTNLEYDYSEQTRCTCKEKVKDCSFWNKVKQSIAENCDPEVAFDLSERGDREHLDRRGGWKKFQLLLGKRLLSTYTAEYLQQYREKNEGFFCSVDKAFPDAEYLVDLSKSAERLDVLLDSDRLDIWCIYLRRDPLKVYASTLKRPKRTRRFLGPKSIREALWLRARTRDMEKTFSTVPTHRRIEVDFVEFTADPDSVLNSVFEQLDLSPLPGNFDAKGFTIQPAHQHIYVGNRWLFNPELSDITIRERSDTAKLSWFQKLMFQVVWWKSNGWKSDRWKSKVLQP